MRILQSQDAIPQDASGDFESVRGTYEENAFVKDMNATIAVLETRIKAFEKSPLKRLVADVPPENNSFGSWA